MMLKELQRFAFAVMTRDDKVILRDEVEGDGHSFLPFVSFEVGPEAPIEQVFAKAVTALATDHVWQLIKVADRHIAPSDSDQVVYQIIALDVTADDLIAWANIGDGNFIAISLAEVANCPDTGFADPALKQFLLS